MRAQRLHKWVRSIAGPSFPKHNLQNNVKRLKKKNPAVDREFLNLTINLCRRKVINTCNNNS